MHSARQLPPDVLDTLERGGVVLCANARAARSLRTLYGASMMAEGLRAWETPQIFDWTQWLHSQWTHLLLSGSEDRAMLTPLQEEVLWQEIVRPGVEASSLIAPGEVARLAMSGYALLSSYDTTRQLQRGEWDHPTLEPEIFRKWAIEMERRCERNRWLCEARLPWVIAEALRSGRATVPPAIVWNGFDRLTPADKAIREVLEEVGCEQTELTWERHAEEKLFAVPSPAGEVEACAVWAKQALQQRPQGTIGILLPDLEGRRAEVDRLFHRVFPGTSTQPLYEFTLGLPLADVPVIAAALALLEWCVKALEQETITWLMTTGFFSAAEDAAVLAEADIKVRKRLSVPELEMEEALERLSKFMGPSGGNWAVANWVRNMQKARAQFLAYQGRSRSCAQWVATAGSILKDAGWPGGHEKQHSDTVHFQVRERWQRALDEVSALGFSDERYTFKEFVGLLASHLRSTIFSPESLNPPITISGIPESAGRSFDAVWILGATDRALPAAAHLHPLLPLWLQMETAMPGSSAAQDWQLSAQVLDRLRDSASVMMYSYATEGKDGAQRPSALLAHLDAKPVEQAESAIPFLAETFVDHMAVPWPGGRAAGGQSVLKDQAACPFRAFAGKRLGAHELPSLEPGLSPAEHGTILHDALSALWLDERMGNSENLKARLWAGELAQVVQQHVANAFAEHVDRASTEWERKYLELDQERICTLLVQWLRYESARKPFTVEQAEKKESIVIDGLELNVRMDRIDKTDAGRLLIDYKTGQVKAGYWETERPSEPQLPIYAVSGKVAELCDVLFAQVRADGSKYISAVYGSKPDIFPVNAVNPDAEASFERLREEWTTTIHALSQEFQRGVATVTPNDYPKTCQYCHFPSLCRIAESPIALAGIDNDDVDGAENEEA